MLTSIVIVHVLNCLVTAFLYLYVSLSPLSLYIFFIYVYVCAWMLFGENKRELY